jgi:glycerol-3-phosphate dehydrogenase
MSAYVLRTMPRDSMLSSLTDAPFDVIVIGGGITGAGVFRLACQRGLRCLLLEQKDFAWGTSSRSGKLVHGGLRYIAQLQLKTSFHSVAEREKLLKAYAGLVNPIEMMVAPPGARRSMKLGLGGLLAVYDWMSGTHRRKRYNREEFLARLPGWANANIGGFSFVDGTTDDARLVLRVLGEGRELGGTALNYVAVRDLLRSSTGNVRGVVAQDAQTKSTYEVRSRVVISATGAWADEMRARMGQAPRIRKLRGSHLVFPLRRLPLQRAAGLISPVDKRSMYVLPWEGRVLLGTTDVDEHGDLSEEPTISAAEQDYLLTTINHWFPEAKLDQSDIIATTAGVRPVVDTGKSNPSRESREEIVWADRGLVTISGGKLTTFALMAEQALDGAAAWLADIAREPPLGSPSEPLEIPDDPLLAARLSGRHGTSASALAAGDRAFERIEDTEFLWAELRHAARHEQVVHLDDLLLRRVRIGLLLPQGGAALLERIRRETQQLLGWEDTQWRQETDRYSELWRHAYGPDAAVF